MIDVEEWWSVDGIESGEDERAGGEMVVGVLVVEEDCALLLI